MESYLGLKIVYLREKWEKAIDNLEYDLADSIESKIEELEDGQQQS
jgi:predicted DNA-binding protein